MQKSEIGPVWKQRQRQVSGEVEIVYRIHSAVIFSVFVVEGCHECGGRCSLLRRFCPSPRSLSPSFNLGTVVCYLPFSIWMDNINFKNHFVDLDYFQRRWLELNGRTRKDLGQKKI